MAFTSNIVSVTSTPTALHAAGPTAIHSIRNLGIGTVYLGIAGAGQQKYPLAGGATINGPIAIANTEVLFARSDEGTVQVAILYN